MKKHLLNSVIFILLPLIAYSQIQLKGKMVTDKGVPVANTFINVAGGPGDKSDVDGNFLIDISRDYIEGQKINLRLVKKGWVINNPLDGNWNLPNRKFHEEYTVDVVIAQKGSVAFWTSDRIEKTIEEMSKQIAHLEKQEKGVVNTTHEEMLRKFAILYGFELDEVKQVFDDWAENAKKSKIKRKQAQAAYYLRNFNSASILFKEAAQEDIESYISLQEQVMRPKTISIYSNFRDSGNSRLNEYNFEDAKDSYSNAKSWISPDNYLIEWVEINLLLIHLNQSIGNIKNGEEVLTLLEESEKLCFSLISILKEKGNLKLLKRVYAYLGNNYRKKIKMNEDSLIQEYQYCAVEYFELALGISDDEEESAFSGRVNNFYGTFLLEKGRKETGAQAKTTLNLAVSKLESATNSKVYKEELFLEWMNSKINLALAFKYLSKRTSKDLRKEHYYNAKSIYTSLLDFCSEDKYRINWAVINNNLGTLHFMGYYIEDRDKEDILDDAIKYFQNALKVRTKEKSPTHWASTKMNIGLCFFYRSLNTSKEEAFLNLKESVESYNETFEIYQRDYFPQDWAMVHQNVGNSLAELAALSSSGDEKGYYFEKSIFHFEESLKVNSRDADAFDWASIMVNIGITYTDWGAGSDADKAIPLLELAIEYNKSAMSEFTKEDEEINWAKIQENLAITNSILGQKRGNKTSFVSFKKALQYLDNALSVFDVEENKMKWAELHKEKGDIYFQWSKIATDTLSASLIIEAKNSYDLALTYINKDSDANFWIAIQLNLGEIYRIESNFGESNNYFNNVLSLEEDNVLALKGLAENCLE